MLNPSYPDLFIFAGMLTGFFAIAKIMLNSGTREREADRKERIKLSDAIDRMADNSAKIASATERGANEAKDRNGHLADLMMNNTSEIVKAVKKHHNQHVTVQKVDTQVVKKEQQ